MYRNPKNLKTEVKIWFLMIKDVAIIGATVAVGFQIIRTFNVHSLVEIIGLIFMLILGIFFSMRTASHPVDRNISLIKFMFQKDNNRYEEIVLEDRVLKSVTHEDMVENLRKQEEVASYD